MLLGFAILLYLLVSAIRGHKLTVFTKTLLSVLCFLQVVCCANMWLYSSDSYDNCELFLLIMDSIEYTIYIDVALVISYQYFTSANNIFIFSRTGVLPGKRSKERNRNLLILGALMTFTVGVVYLFGIIYLNRRQNWVMYNIFTMATEAVGIGLQIIVCILFALTLNHLRRSRAVASEPGQLSRKNIWLGLILLTVNSVAQILILAHFTSFSEYTLVTMIIFSVLQYIVYVILTYIIISFELTDFTLRTVVLRNGQLEV